MLKCTHKFFALDIAVPGVEEIQHSPETIRMRFHAQRLQTLENVIACQALIEQRLQFISTIAQLCH
jgi:hypothetical protein